MEYPPSARVGLLTGTPDGIQGLDIGTYERVAELLGVPNNGEGRFP
jgi:hypothetical protein